MTVIAPFRSLIWGIRSLNFFDFKPDGETWPYPATRTPRDTLWTIA